MKSKFVFKGVLIDWYNRPIFARNFKKSMKIFSSQSLIVFVLSSLITVSAYSQSIPPVSEGTLESLGLDQSSIDAILSTTGQTTTTTPTAAETILDAQENAVQQANDQINTTVAAPPPAIAEIIADVTGEPSAPATIWGQDFFRNGSVDLFDKVTNAKVNDNYILGSGDQLTIAIWGYAYYNQSFTINDDGYITTLEVGRIYLKGLTFSAAKQLLRQRFASAFDLSNSNFDVTLTYSKSIKVNIIGEVVSPGSYNISSLNTAFNALVAAGGVTDIGSVRNIQIKRNGKIIRTLDVYQYLMNSGSTDDNYLEANDYIIVNGIGRVVEIQGEVNRPYKYELITGENLNEAIYYAGGLKSTAYTRNVSIYRYANNENKVLDINLDSLIKMKINVPLFNGDKIVITKIPELIENIVTIQGAVRIPGNYELTEGMHISEIIEKARGLTYEAYTNRAYLIRKDKNLNDVYIPFDLQDVMQNPSSPFNLTLAKFDIIDVFSKEKFKEIFTVKLEGAVKTPGDFPYNVDMTLKDLLYYSGGLKLEAANNRIEISRIINFKDAVSNDNPTRMVIETVAVNKSLEITDAGQNFILQPYDQVYVRTTPEFEFQRNITLAGEVKYPGTYTLLYRTEKVADVIVRAGGLTQYAYAEGATLNRTGVSSTLLFLDKAMKDTTSRYNYVLKEGDNVFIPRKGEQVIMIGAITYPTISIDDPKVMVPYDHNKTARRYVKKYGKNFAKNADRNETYVIQPNGYLQKTHHFWFIRFYPRIKVKGSTIVVPEEAPEKIEQPDAPSPPSTPVDWNIVIATISAGILSFATIYVLINNSNGR